MRTKNEDLSVVFLLILGMCGLINSSMAQPIPPTNMGAADGQHSSYQSFDPFNPAMTHFYMGGAEGFTKRCKTCLCEEVGGKITRKRCASPGYPRHCPKDEPEGTCPCKSSMM